MPCTHADEGPTLVRAMTTRSRERSESVPAVRADGTLATPRGGPLFPAAVSVYRRVCQ
jgi:hypothetical protein